MPQSSRGRRRNLLQRYVRRSIFFRIHVLFFSRVNRHSSSLIEGENFIGLWIRPLHSRRTDRHARDAETKDGWFFLQHLFDHIRRNMALDDVTIDKRRVA